MAASADQLLQFHRFAIEKVNAGSLDLSIEVLLQMWRRESDRVETVEAIQRGIADIEADRSHTLGDLDAEIRRRFDNPAKR